VDVHSNKVYYNRNVI